MLPIPYTLVGIYQLLPEQKAALAASLLTSYPIGLEEDQILQHPLTYLLTLLYEPELPREVPPTPSEIFSMVGYAATNRQRLTTRPPQYVWGEVRNLQKSQAVTAKAVGWQRYHQKNNIAPEDRANTNQLFSRLPSELRTTLLLSWRYSVTELAALWGITPRATKERIYQARKRGKKYLEI